MLRCAVLLILLAVAPEPFKVAAIPLKDLVAQSPLIVVAHITRVDNVGDLAVARVSVDQVVKGDPDLKTLAVVAAKTWTCDISHAEAGEAALLFLSAGESLDMTRGALKRARVDMAPQPLYVQAHSGRGRMPIHMGSSDSHVQAYGDIVEVESWPGTCAQCTWRHQRSLVDVLTDVHRIMQDQSRLARALPP